MLTRPRTHFWKAILLWMVWIMVGMPTVAQCACLCQGESSILNTYSDRSESPCCALGDACSSIKDNNEKGACQDCPPIKVAIEKSPELLAESVSKVNLTTFLPSFSLVGYYLVNLSHLNDSSLPLLAEHNQKASPLPPWLGRANLCTWII